MLDAVSSTAFDQYLLQKPIVQKYPPHDYYIKIRKVFAPIAPSGLNDVLLTGTSPSHAIEVALRNALSYTVRNSKRSFAKGISVLTFEGSSHGRAITTLGLSNEKSLSERLPSLSCVTVPLPVAKLPMHLNFTENACAEKEVLRKIMETIEAQDRTQPVGAIIVEPIQNRDNNFASADFYKALRQIAKTKGIPFVVNEVHTGCGATGKFWAVEHWATEDIGDFLVFGKKCQVAGFFTSPEYRPVNKTDLSDDWNDVGWRLIQLEAVLKGIANRSLLPHTADTGAYLRSELGKIEANRKYISRVRGQGTFIGFDIPRGHAEAVRLVNYLKDKGIYVRLFGEATIGLRPALILEPIHAHHLLKALEEYPYKETISPLL